jgi:N-succinyldiaminopimelate aminotransferase
MSDRLDPLQRFHPFTRLNALLAGIEPGAARPLLFSVGEPQQTPPELIRPLLTESLTDWGRYPPTLGTAAFRQAAAEWLTRRFRLPAGMVDPDRHVMPCAGTRQALFFIALAAVPEAEAGRPAVLMPNPFYHVYAGAAAMAGAEPVFLPATPETGFLPVPEAVPRPVLARTALAYVCSPTNPQGAVADRRYLARWLALGREHGFTVAFDECYSEIYRDRPPAGALEAAAEAGGSLEGLMVFHSLSKRSAGAGLRSGFVAGDARLVQRIAQLVNYGGVAVPLPILAASTALWRDEAHVATNRALYNENFALARRILGNRLGHATPEGGFFLWLDVGDGETAAKRLWAEAGLKVLPGGYMARPDAGGRNPGQRYIRVALVYDAAATADGLERLVRVLAPDSRQPGGPGARSDEARRPEAQPGEVRPGVVRPEEVRR